MPIVYSPNVRRVTRNNSQENASQDSGNILSTKTQKKGKSSGAVAKDLNRSKPNNIYEILEENENSNQNNDVEDCICMSCKTQIDHLTIDLCCDFCKEKYHPGCLKFNSSNLKKALKQPFWFCSKNCEKDFKNCPQNKNLTNFDNNSTMQEILKQLQQNNESLQYMSNVFDENQRIIKEFGLLRNENLEIRKELDFLKYELNQFKYEKIKNNIIVYGLNQDSAIEEENHLKEKLKSVLKNINVIVNDDDIDSAYRIQNKNDKRSGPVVYELKKQEKKILILKSRKALRNRNQHEKDFVRINEQLTNFSHKILMEARNKLGDMFKFIWSRNGRILLKKDEGSKPTELFMLDDINSLLN